MLTTVAIIGSGFGMYCLLPAFSKIKGCKVVSICGKNSPRMGNLCKKFQIQKYNNWKEMLQKEKPDAVAIAVIPKHQFEIAKYALENGISVFAEKPLSMNYQDSFELSELAKKHQLPNVVDFEFPEIPEWEETKQIIENDTIGKISLVNVNWNFLSYDLSHEIKSWKTDVEQGGGAISLVLSHTFHYLEFFLGVITDIKSTISSSEKSLNNGDTTIKMTLLFENGCKGTVNLDISDSNNQTHSLKFHGENGILMLQNTSDSFVDNFELILIRNNEEKKIIPKKSLNLSEQPGEDDRIKVVNSLATKFINWCKFDNPARPNFQDGLRVQKLIELLRNSNSII
jgi:predicted dehydrogenase